MNSTLKAFYRRKLLANGFTGEQQIVIMLLLEESYAKGLKTGMDAVCETIKTMSLEEAKAVDAIVKDIV